MQIYLQYNPPFRVLGNRLERYRSIEYPNFIPNLLIESI